MHRGWLVSWLDFFFGGGSFILLGSILLFVSSCFMKNYVVILKKQNKVKTWPEKVQLLKAKLNMALEKHRDTNTHLWFWSTLTTQFAVFISKTFNSIVHFCITLLNWAVIQSHSPECSSLSLFFYHYYFQHISSGHSNQHVSSSLKTDSLSVTHNAWFNGS